MGTRERLADRRKLIGGGRIQLAFPGAGHVAGARRRSVVVAAQRDDDQPQEDRWCEHRCGYSGE